MYEFFPWLIDMNLFETSFTEQEIQPVIEVLKSGKIGFGSNVVQLENKFSKYSNKKYNIATNSASASAFMIFHFLKEKYGTCDVYTPSLGFISPVWAAKHFGHNICFVDVGTDLLFDSRHYKYLREKSDSQNKTVLMPVLYGGVSDIPSWKIYGDEVVVVDSAHNVTSNLDCDFIFFSFHPYKPVCTSDGGIISTSHKKAADYFNSYRNFGRLNLDGTYDIVQEGFKFYMNNLNATIGLVSLAKYEKNLSIRKNNYLYLQDKINNNSRLIDHDIDSSYYFATAITQNSKQKMDLLNLVKLYPLIHKTKHFSQDISLKNTELMYNNFCNLPLHCNLAKEDLDFIVEVING